LNSLKVAVMVEEVMAVAVVDMVVVKAAVVDMVVVAVDMAVVDMVVVAEKEVTKNILEEEIDFNFLYKNKFQIFV
jgi:hypothetical protein